MSLCLTRSSIRDNDYYRQTLTIQIDDNMLGNICSTPSIVAMNFFVFVMNVRCININGS